MKSAERLSKKKVVTYLTVPVEAAAEAMERRPKRLLLALATRRAERETVGTKRGATIMICRFTKECDGCKKKGKKKKKEKREELEGGEVKKKLTENF